MAQSKRKLFSVVDHSDPPPSANDSDSAADPAPTGVSGLLRSAREETGLTLWEVSQNLRIRFSYMQAIEDGRFDDLPGPVYAVGFIRTYALYLNLDADELVRRFKNERSGLTERQDLVFPAPPPESRTSGLAIGLVALLIAAGAYGGWYYLSSQGDQDVAEVAPIPDRFATLLEQPPAEAGSAAASPVATGSETLPALPADESNSGASVAIVDGELPALPLAVELAELPAQDGLTGDQADVTSLAALERADVQTPDSQQLAEGPIEQGSADTDEGVDVDSPGLDTGTATGLGAGVSETGVAVAAAPPEPPAEPEVQPAVAAARVEMVATTDSWVLIRDAEGDMVMTRVMTPGDSYQVPEQEGLTLFTGNAGGLDILVDGEAVPSLGRQGEVIRNISLDPDLLRQGEAIISQ